MFVCLFVCLYLCSIWPAKRLGRSRPNLTRTHVHPGSVSVKVNVKVIHVCVGVTELRNTRNAARKRPLANAAQTTSGGRGRRHLANAYETPSGRRVITA